ncbi:MAG: S1 RNA-binding domain-containing protein [Butyricicoccus pullicaecorum]|nr:S1 RNA-binding domain-containing protein [Butyricicoccus pullicaecorum]
MGLVVGAVLEGKVTGITKFGAFVSLPEGKSGMVHISEVANSFVSDIKEFLKEGDTVRVKVINVDDAGRINLSIKRAQENSQQSAVRTGCTEQRRTPRPRTGQFQGGGRTVQSKQPRDPATMTFEDKLKMFMADSESRMADIRHNTDRKSGSRRRK